MALHAWDSGGGYGCVILINDVVVPYAVLGNHFKCTPTNNVAAGTDWLARDFDDSQWLPASTAYLRIIDYYTSLQAIWAQGVGVLGNIYCRFQIESNCPFGSEPYEGKCWCSLNHKSDSGLGPCDPCDDNAFSSTLGSKMCTCAANAFSINGFDTPNSCESCPG